MAMTNCRECGKQVSSEAAVCPHCGIKKPAPKRIGIGGVLVLAVVGFIAFRVASPGPDTVSDGAASFTHIDALALCQYALKRTAKDPERSDIPYVQNAGSGNEAYFAWGRDTKMARMRNGLGLEVAVSASCTVDLPSKKITTLTLEGKSIL